MNKVDQEFYNLTDIIKSQSLEEIYLKIKNKYLNIPENIKNAIENFF